MFRSEKHPAMKPCTSPYVAAATLMVLGIACGQSEPDKTMNDATFLSNAGLFAVESPLSFNHPQFDQLDDALYRPAFEQGMTEHLAEVEAIATSNEAPTLENTLVALERSGRILERVQRVFFNLVSADTNDTLDEIRTEMAPKLSAHDDSILLNDRLFARVKTLYDTRHSLDLDDESRRLVEEYYADFVRAGAQLSDPDKQHLREINAELASLQTAFSQNVLSEVNTSGVVVDTREELVGLSEGEISAAAESATEEGLEGKFLIALRNTSSHPMLSSLANRDLRRRVMETSLGRGSRGGEFDNTGVVSQVASLRAERATLLGYATYADYRLERQTAQTVDAVNERLASLTPAAVANAKREADDLQVTITSGGEAHDLAPWDWAYYVEKVREDRYAFDASQLRPYFEIENVLQNGVFYAASRLYGLTFEERTDLPVYHPDVRVFEVSDDDGTPLALFLGDYYARPSKRGGAWMNSFVSQSDLLDTRPVIANFLNILKPPDGEPTLLTFDEVETMFHEFGHALHGMFSSVRYPYFSGTSVPRDFVEYPSQVNEMWATWPDVIQHYAVHHETGEPMPAELLKKMLSTETFNQGFATTEYLAAALLDQAWHQLSADQVPSPDEVLAFEQTALEKAGIALRAVPPRYRSTYFSHIWSSGYAAAYYAYIWSEVLDADSVEWFKENGGLTRANGNHFRQTLLSQGGSRDAMEMFRSFRGRNPEIAPLLARRGLDQGP